MAPANGITLDMPQDEKRQLLRRLGVPLSPEPLLKFDSSTPLETLLLATRVHCLSKVELYFLQGPHELRVPLNLRNEAAAVSLLLQQLGERGGGAGGCAADTGGLRSALLEHCLGLWPEFAAGDVSLCGAAPPPGRPPPANSGAADFERWAAERGVEAAISIADFGGLRGCALARDLAPGEPLLSIPEGVLIYIDTILETDLGRMLSAIPGLGVENTLLLFTMIDRHDEDSGWRRYWASLPDAYRTGLSFPEALVEALAGTAAGAELRAARSHLAAQYQATRPIMDMLLQAYPGLLQPEYFTYEAYLWAAELWYSYAFEVEFPGGPGTDGAASSKPVMVPYACHVNHSPWPHVVRYGRLDAATRMLRFPAFRPAARGGQAFISYGPVPNLKLLCYYGFVIASNPHDLVLLRLEAPEGGLGAAQARALEAWGLADLEHNLRDGPLSPRLLACLRLIVATDNELEALAHGEAGAADGSSGADGRAAGAAERGPLAGPLGPENEAQALRTLEAALLALLQQAQTCRLAAAAAEAGGATEAASSAAAAVAAGHRGAGGAAEAAWTRLRLGPQWRGSYEFCVAFVEGQLRILRRALRECRALLRGVGAEAVA